MANVAYDALPKHHAATKSEKLVIGASSLGTVFEWYDFYIFGTLASIMGSHFFEAKGINATAAFIFALLAFAAGFLVRPFGALVFGRLGDLVGRKYTFLVTMGLMGLSTFLVGVLPTYAQIGIAAPILLVALRMVQGLALGGEYGGAATYVAEHAPNSKRGLYTAWIQTTATMGLFLALGVILLTRLSMDAAAFKEWGWRVPFLMSVALLAVSLWIRMQLEESPVFKAMKDEGTHSKAPLKEAFGEWGNLKIVILALFGLVAGQAVVWYTGQFYALFFLEKMMKVDSTVAYIMIAVALAIGTPGFIFFGWLSDKIGRKPIILAGLAIAALTYFPLFGALTEAVNPQAAAAMRNAPIQVVADPADCSFQFAPGELKGHITYKNSCDIAKSALAGRFVSYEVIDAPAGAPAVIRVGDQAFPAFNGSGLSAADFKAKATEYGKAINAAVSAAGYPDKADSARINYPVAIAILALLVVYVTMVYGPMAATLVEMFPTKIRYTSMSLPYHIGNGWFGGLLPAITFAMIASNGNIYFGLWYPIAIAAATLVIGLLFVKETRTNNIDA